MLEKVKKKRAFFFVFIEEAQLSDEPPRTRITSVQQVDYSGKVEGERARK